jgi:hypothetical protein
VAVPAKTLFESAFSTYVKSYLAMFAVGARGDVILKLLDPGCPLTVDITKSAPS